MKPSSIMSVSRVCAALTLDATPAVRSAVTMVTTIAIATLVYGFATTVRAQQARVDRPDISHETAIVKQYMQTPQLRKALGFVEGQIADPSDAIQDWLGVCNALGPSHDEIYRARHIYKMFRIYGLEQVYIDDQHNVVAVRPGKGNGPKVVLAAHHDNVPIWPKDQPVEAFERDGRIYCPGAGDDLPGVVQLFTVLRAMNAADVETEGDVWFVTFSGEETGSPGAESFALAHYPHNLDWRKGDAVVELHGGAGEGVTTGSGPMIVRATLRFFTPFERKIEGQTGADRRWRPHAVDVLARALVRIRSEVTDPRADCLRCTGLNAQANVEKAEWYLNISMPQGSAVVNRPASEAMVRIDLRAPTTAQLQKLLTQIQQIAVESCAELESKGFAPHHYKERCGYMLDLNESYGRDWTTSPIAGWDLVDNPQARYVAAAAGALYGGEPEIDPKQGCGDCTNLYKGGLPGFSFRGDLVDYGKGRVERHFPTQARLGGHDVTESMAVPTLWAGVKHALVFAVSYAGMPGTKTKAR